MQGGGRLEGHGLEIAAGFGLRREEVLENAARDDADVGASVEHGLNDVLGGLHQKALRLEESGRIVAGALDFAHADEVAVWAVGMVGDQGAVAHVLKGLDPAAPAGEEERAVGLVRVGKAAVGDGEEVARAFGQIAARDARR